MKVLKGFVIFLVIVLAIIVIIVSCSDTEEEPISEPEATEEPITDSPEALVISVVGEKTNHGEGEYEDPIVDISMEGETLNLILIGNDNFSANYIRLGMLMDSGEIYEQVFDLFPEINRTYIEWQFPLVDTYGNEQLGTVMKVELSRETEAKINWENFLTEDLPDVADFYWQHGGLD